MDTIERIRKLIDPVLDERSVDLYDLELEGGVLRVTIDRPGGVDVDVVGGVSRDLSRLLDEHDPIAGSFVLEVSSPGVERALRTPAHFGGAVGEDVNVKLRPGTEGDRRFRGRVVAVEGTVVTFAVEGQGDRDVDLGDITRARTAFDWGPAPKPKSPGTSRTKKKRSKDKATKP